MSSCILASFSRHSVPSLNVPSGRRFTKQCSCSILFCSAILLCNIFAISLCMAQSVNTIPVSHAQRATVVAQTGNLTCSTDLLSVLLQTQGDQLLQFYTSPIDAMRALRNSLAHGIGIPWNSQYMPYQEFPFNPSQLTPLPTGARVDLNPNRFAESFVGSNGWDFQYDTTCQFHSGSTFNASCVIPKIDNIVQNCQTNWASECPSPLSDLLAHPKSSSDWNVNGRKCPSYCLNPGLYNNSMVNFMFALGNPWMLEIDFYYQQFAGKVNDWYLCMNDGQIRYYPSLQSGGISMADVIGTDINNSEFPLYPTFYRGGPAENPQRQGYFGDAYIDIITSKNMITGTYPIYEGDDFWGLLLCDIIIDSTRPMMDETATLASPHSLVMLIDGNGQLLTSTQLALDRLFCPKYCQVNNITGEMHFDPNADTGAQNSFGTAFTVKDSPYSGFNNLLQSLTSAPFTRSTQTVELILHDIWYSVSWTGLSTANIAWYFLIAVPSLEMNEAANWLIKPASVNAAQSRVDQSQEAVLYNQAGYPFHESQSVSVHSIQVSNVGLSSLAFSVTSPVDWIKVALRGTLEAVNASQAVISSFPRDLPGYDASQVTYDLLYRQVNQSDVFSSLNFQSNLYLDVFVDWSRADGRDSVNLVLRPSTATGVGSSQCFGNMAAPVLLQYATVVSRSEIPRAITWSVVALTIVTIVALLLIIALNIVFRNAIVIKSSAPLFNILSLIGAIATQLCSILFVVTLPTNNSAVCSMRVWALPISVTLMLTPLFVKSYRLARIFGTKLIRVVYISDLKLFLFTSAVVLGCVIITAAHEAVNSTSSLYQLVEISDPTNTAPPSNAVGVYGVFAAAGSEVNTFAECSIARSFQIAILCYVFVLTAAGVKTAWSVRDIPSRYNESLLIFTSCAFALIYGVLIIPLQFLLTSQPVALAVLRGYGITVGVWVSMGAVFGPKVMQIHASFTSGLSDLNTERTSDTTASMNNTLTTTGLGLTALGALTSPKQLHNTPKVPSPFPRAVNARKTQSQGISSPPSNHSTTLGGSKVVSMSLGTGTLATARQTPFGQKVAPEGLPSPSPSPPIVESPAPAAPVVALNPISPRSPRRMRVHVSPDALSFSGAVMLHSPTTNETVITTESTPSEHFIVSDQQANVPQ